IESALDKQEQIASTNISAGFSGITLDGIEGYINKNELYVGLPFLDNILKLNSEDFGRILHEIDPATFTGEEKIDFSQFFADSSLMTEDVEYLEKEYVEYLYNESPEEAFESGKENVSVGGSDISAEKITFHLSEEQIQTLLKNLFSKMAEDEKLKEIIVSQITYTNFVSPAVVEEEIATFKEDYVTGLEEAAKEIENVKFPDGFTSTIWVKDDIIVKRHLSIAAGSDESDLTSGFTIEGTNAVSDASQQMDYAITANDGISEETVNISADLSHQDGETKDTITLTAGELDVTLESTQSKTEDSGKNFEHTFSMNDGSTSMSLHWLGEANYEKDQMTVDHTFFLDDGVTFNQDVFSLFVKETGSTIDKVELPSSDQVKNLSDMSGEEIIQYFETDVMSQFQGWMMNMMGPGF
ncbi:DUF6583 family protein, partial [Gracilibacillus oryzae]|uniref:DUF6583 family protein n=1 Tax=Gracilibacillus oryzae TaxID=1672701 RepID=UPI0018863056